MTENLFKPPHLRKRSWIICFVAIAALIAGIGYTQYSAEEQHIVQKQAQTLTAVGVLKANQIAAWRKEKLADVARFSQGPALISAVQDLLLAPDDSAHQKNVRHMVNLNLKGDLYQNTLIVSAEGKTLCVAVATSDSLPEPTRKAINAVISTRAPSFSGAYRYNQDKVAIDALAPICTPEGQLLAVLIQRTDASAFLYPLIKFWPTESPTAETLLVRREGDEVVFLNAVRHDAHAALDLRIPVTRKDLPAVKAVLGVRGICQGKDYRDIGVLADLRPIPGSDWFIVTKIDQSEIQAEVRYHALIIFRFACLGILLAAALTAAGYRKRQSHLYRDLYQTERESREAHEKFETILYSIGDAVMVTDDQARICQMNPVAEHLTGWKESEALGHSVKDIFNIVNQETRQPVENPVWRVLRDGKIVGLANHTVLIARDGTERPIADSGAPVRDNQGTVSGVVLVFRDQSADYAAQKALLESEAQYRDLFDNMAEAFALHEIICDPQGNPIDYRFLKVNPAFERLTGLQASQIVGRRVLEVLPGTEPHWIETYGAVAKDGKAKHFEIHSAPLGRNFRVTAFRPRPGQFCTIFDDITEILKNEEVRKTLENQLQQSQRVEAVGRLAGGVAHDFNNMLAVILGNAEMVSENLTPSHSLHADVNEIIKAGKRSADLVRQLLAFASKQTILPRILNLNDSIASMLTMLKRLIGEDIQLDWRPDPNLGNVKMDPSQIDQILVNLMVNARDALNKKGTISIRTSNVTLSPADSQALPQIPPGHFILLSVSDNGCGMDEETKAHIFEPFFTTKQKAISTGLGLSTVYGILKQNHGFINVTSKVGSGTRFDIYLPRRDPEEPAKKDTSVAKADAPQTGTETILLVEDEPALLSLAQNLINKMGYTVLVASNPDEALKVSASYDKEIQLLMTDVVMPEMSGYDLWKQLVHQRPSLKSLYISGYTANIIAHHGILDRDINFLQKPFSKESLAAKLREVLLSSKT